MPTTIELFHRSEAEAIVYEPGQIVFEQGEFGDNMYAILEGEVEIVVDGEVFDVGTAGGIVGEMALIDASPRSATARAKTMCKLVPVDAKRFEFLVQQTPFFSLQVMGIMADRLRRLMKRTVAD